MSSQLCEHNIFIGIDCEKCNKSPRVEKLKKELDAAHKRDVAAWIAMKDLVARLQTENQKLLKDVDYYTGFIADNELLDSYTKYAIDRYNKKETK